MISSSNSYNDIFLDRTHFKSISIEDFEKNKFNFKKSRINSPYSELALKKSGINAIDEIFSDVNIKYDKYIDDNEIINASKEKYFTGNNDFFINEFKIELEKKNSIISNQESNENKQNSESNEQKDEININKDEKDNKGEKIN